MSMTEIDEVGPWATATFNPLDWMPALPSHFPIERPPARLGHHSRLTSTSQNIINQEAFELDSHLFDSEDPVRIRVFEIPNIDENANLVDEVLDIQMQQDELMEQIEMLERAHEELDAARNELFRTLLQIEEEHMERLPRYEDVVEEDSETCSSVSDDDAENGLGIREIPFRERMMEHRNSQKPTLKLDANGNYIYEDELEYILDR